MDNRLDMSDEKIVTQSYYVVKVSRFNKDRYIGVGSNGKIKMVDSEDKARKFLYFGLKGMEEALLKAVESAKDLKKSMHPYIYIVGENIETYMSEVLDKNMYQKFFAWNKVINNNNIDDIINTMIEMTKKEYGELKNPNILNNKDNDTENYVTIHKFLSHVKELDLKSVLVTAMDWNKFDETRQVNLAYHFAGEYNLSRFIIFMDYLNDSMVNGDLIKNLGIDSNE